MPNGSGDFRRLCFVVVALTALFHGPVRGILLNGGVPFLFTVARAVAVRGSVLPEREGWDTSGHLRRYRGVESR